MSLHAWLRWDLVQRALAEVPRGADVLEIGTGQGAVAVRLAERFSYTGIEADPASHASTVNRLAGRGRVIHGSYDGLSAHARYDAVCAFEVLEHLEDDRAALDAWRALVRPGGLLLISVPLGPDRFGPWDELVGHYRRYSRAHLEELLGERGFAGVQAQAYGFPLGHALEQARNTIARRRQRKEVLVGRSAQERTAASGRSLQPSRQLGLLTQTASAPFRIAQRPFTRTELGTGLVAAAWKPA